jgi:hypothetical protein
MIKSISEKDKVEIDLTGTQGNVFYLIGFAQNLAKQLNKLRGADYQDPKAIVADMMSGDYDHAVDVMEREFGHLIIMYR